MKVCKYFLNPYIELKTVSKSFRNKKLEKPKQNSTMVYIKNLPYKLGSSTYNMIRRANNYVRVDKSDKIDKRIRIPRYFSYTKELEPYSQPKAYVVQIMKYKEHIVSIYTLKLSEVVFTESRLLHVTKGDDKNQSMDHWSVPYSDIVNVKVIKLNIVV